MPNKGKVQDTFTITLNTLSMYDRHSIEETRHSSQLTVLTCLCGREFGGRTITNALNQHAIHAREAEILEKHNVDQLRQLNDNEWYGHCTCEMNFIAFAKGQLEVLRLWDDIVNRYSRETRIRRNHGSELAQVQ